MRNARQFLQIALILAITIAGQSAITKIGRREQIEDGRGWRERGNSEDDIGHTTFNAALMPTLCWSPPPLKSTADGLSLAVQITHELKLYADDEPVLKIQKFPPQESLDILSSSSVLLRLTGSFEMKQVPTETFKRSSLAAYLLEYLKHVWNDTTFRPIHSLF
jgi:hypothetical protein